MVQTKESIGKIATPAQWLGKSGRRYVMSQQNLDRFAMQDADLYVMVRGTAVLWVGSTRELVGEPVSRRKFRQALNRADAVFHLEDGMAEADHLSTIVDLEGGRLLAGPEAQAA